MCLVGVVQPEVVVGSRKPVRELNRVADVSRWYGRVRLREPVRWVVVEPIKSILLLIYIRDFYHEVSTKAVLQESRKWENYENASQHNSRLWKEFNWLGTFWNRTNEQIIVFQTATTEEWGKYLIAAIINSLSDGERSNFSELCNFFAARFRLITIPLIDFSARFISASPAACDLLSRD